MFKLCPYASTEEDVISALDAIQTLIRLSRVDRDRCKLFRPQTDGASRRITDRQSYPPLQLHSIQVAFGLISASLLNCLYPYLLEESWKHERS